MGDCFGDGRLEARGRGEIGEGDRRERRGRGEGGIEGRGMGLRERVKGKG